VLFQWLRHSVGIDHIVAKAVDVLGSIRAECAQSLHVDRMAFLEQLLQSLGHRYQRVERQQIRYQVIVFNELTLLIAHVLGDHALATEAHPLHEFVEGLAFVGGGLDYLPQFEVGDVLQQKDGPHHPSQFAKREVQLVFTTVGVDPTVVSPAAILQQEHSFLIRNTKA
jgi:hypothetical protein